jgi:hypothetical protein
MEVYAKTYQVVDVDPIDVLKKLFKQNCHGMEFEDVDIFLKEGQPYIMYEEYRFHQTQKNISSEKYELLMNIRNLILMLSK